MPARAVATVAADAGQRRAASTTSSSRAAGRRCKIGIGVNTGLMHVGDMGSKIRRPIR